MMRVFTSKLFVLLFLAINLRGSLGYIFRWGDPAASPTYSDRPMVFFVFWDIVIGLMAILVACKTRKISKNYVSIYLLTLLISFVCLFQAESFYVRGSARGIILYGFFFLCLYSNGDWIKISHINKAIEFMAAFGLLFLVYQLYQYYSFGILPAHSTQNMFIRYGSFYDDSLVLGLLLPMFAGYFFNKYKKTFPSLLIAAIICLVVILTGSMTSMGIVFLYVAWSFRKRYGLLLFFLCASLGPAIYFIDQINYLWLFKSGSIAGHLEGLSYFKDLGLLNLIGFQPLDKFAEMGYLSFLCNFGVFILIIVLAFHLKALSACRTILSKGTSNREMLLFAGAAQGLTISVLLANLNYPPIVYPPVYLLVVIFSAIVMKRSANTNFRKNSRIKIKPHLSLDEGVSSMPLVGH